MGGGGQIARFFMLGVNEVDVIDSISCASLSTDLQGSISIGEQCIVGHTDNHSELVHI